MYNICHGFGRRLEAADVTYSYVTVSVSIVSVTSDALGISYTSDTYV